ncbi:MAG: copper homeostasis protein CutC [Bacteroidia bacterium]|nr:copper homeostasis protein CutC [Bacteroidia bacterium]
MSEIEKKIKAITEVVVFSVEGAIDAQKGGAQRVELCENSQEGGTTPSIGTVAVTRKCLNIKLFVMIRPRGGDFLYSPNEYEAMQTDIENYKKLDIDGFVFGILKSNGDVDTHRCKMLVELAKPIPVTFHRAFDRTSNPEKALEDIISCGFERILTSGLKQSAADGANMIAKLIEQAKGRIIIMPGGGVRKENVIEIKQKTGAVEFHTSARTIIKSSMNNPDSNFTESDILGTDLSMVKEFVSTLNEITL